MPRVERVQECVQALNHADQVQMARYVLAGWSFGLYGLGSYKWQANHRGRAEVHYGTTLLSVLSRMSILEEV